MKKIRLLIFFYGVTYIAKLSNPKLGDKINILIIVMQVLNFIGSGLLGMRYKVEIFDFLLYMHNSTGFHDHQVHFVIKFKDKLNDAVFLESVKLLVKVIPALSWVYRNHNGDSYWEDPDNINWHEIFSIVKTEKEFESFTLSKLNWENGSQIKVCMLQAEKAAVSVIINHMLGDGAAVKECMYTLADIYSNLIKNPQYMPDYVIDGDRSYNEVVSGISFRDRMKIFFLNNNENNQKNICEFPMDTGNDVSPFIYTHDIMQKQYYMIRKFCKDNTVTINDFILTVFFRVLSKMLGFER
jgi:NRPS condensation-like uncharacterized protein